MSTKSDMKVLTVDIETSPSVAHVWGLFKQSVSLSQLQESTRVISFAAKWHGVRAVEFRSDFHDGHEAMVQRAHALIDEADVVVHYNGKSFDMPHLRREFLLANMPPPSPVREVDLYLVVRSRFRFISNKLDHVTRELGLTGKVTHTGHDLWVRCMAGDPKAWALMKKYNKGDVVTTEELHDVLLPWINGYPHAGLYGDSEVPTCQRCGGHGLRKEGFAYTALGKFQRYACKDCGSWSRGKSRLAGVDIRAIS